MAKVKAKVRPTVRAKKVAKPIRAVKKTMKVDKVAALEKRLAAGLAKKSAQFAKRLKAAEVAAYDAAVVKVTALMKKRDALKMKFLAAAEAKFDKAFAKKNKLKLKSGAKATKAAKSDKSKATKVAKAAKATKSMKVVKKLKTVKPVKTTKAVKAVKAVKAAKVVKAVKSEKVAKKMPVKKVNVKKPKLVVETNHNNHVVTPEVVG